MYYAIITLNIEHKIELNRVTSRIREVLKAKDCLIFYY